MAPMEATLFQSQPEGISDNARARELYKYVKHSAPLTGPEISHRNNLQVSKELYFRPPEPNLAPVPTQETAKEKTIQSDVTSTKVSSPDTALTAFCQLLAWRTNAQRAMIGLIDADTQYFVAESTRTLDLVDGARHAPGDDLWMGCSSVSKGGKLCERTIAVEHTESVGDYPAFIVNDLQKDERFNQLPFVTGAPYLRFYAGVPLITKRGIAIGSLFIIDDYVRNGLSSDDVHFMGAMARTVMSHLEMAREVEEHRRGMKMSRGLASFVQGHSEVLESDLEPGEALGEGEGTRIAGKFEREAGTNRTKSKASHRSSVDSTVSSAQGLERKEREYSANLAKTEEALLRENYPKPEVTVRRPEISSGSHGESHISLGTATTDAFSPLSRSDTSPADTLSEESSQRQLASRAANLIRETFEVDGGCIFYDAQAGFAPDPPQSRLNQIAQDESQTDSQVASGDELLYSNEPREPLPFNPPTTRSVLSDMSPSLTPRDATFSRSSNMSHKLADILGFSTPGASSIHGDLVPGLQSFRPLQEKALNSLLRRFPRGKLWTFDSEGEVSSSSEEDHRRSRKNPLRLNQELMQKKARSAKPNSHAKFLTRHFPGVRQLLFVPLWDAGRSRWLSGCFVWSTEATRVLSKESELSFLTGFGNSVMAEWSRIDTQIANQKKDDFIGSISHELRSPLHGILASAEFLSEEVKSTFELGMVETISSCGRTLLDTINHVLDFSKINHFERTWRKNHTPHTRPIRNALALKQSELPMINLYADVDVSVICEEVVEGVFAGHLFQSSTAANFDMVQDSSKRMPSPSKDDLQAPSRSTAPEVAVIFDVDFQNYQFTTQPGAFRRVVMNLLGNALKYTARGYVRIKLTSTPMEDFHDVETRDIIPRAMLVLTVTDTGKGIAPEFLRSKLFTPFAQENSLSSGTGLGLSIVKSIVKILEGDLTIESEVGRGTQVHVSLPLMRGALKTSDPVPDTPKSSMIHEPDDAIAKLKSLVVGQRVSLHGFESGKGDPLFQKMERLLQASIVNILQNWYGMQVVPLGQKASIIVSNEGDPATINKIVRSIVNTHRLRPSVVVLCSHLSKFDRATVEAEASIGHVTKPVGPLKLGRAIAQCLGGSLPATPGQVDVIVSPNSNDMSNLFEEMTLNPAAGEVLDNSRMAADSDNARKAIESPTPNAVADKASEFPFPISDSPGKAKSLPLGKKVLQTVGTKSAQSEDDTPTSSQKKKLPSFLLVDDNAINLKLLGTSIQKRNHLVIDKAMDGLAAVKAFQDRSEGYDIIFMDISMPLLDGFGATKEIRALEESRKQKAEEENDSFTPALIIALTGLASSEDQSKAAKVGVDLFLTKPVSFRDVKKMLDNWEANR
ncbi:hypothetical protein HYFRA_00011268 [Hymenoscyphus fraxineus]|uniref:histidine kinase n=1 Tax=Hymenoscyphus fraxineus TaxID=746836 RepID=A0A9N9KWQ6_9HELO|nr:hypothetical protein HYFRA_00011268 [Hymenoscyphus fraxineus]